VTELTYPRGQSTASQSQRPLGLGGSHALPEMHGQDDDLPQARQQVTTEEENRVSESHNFDAALEPAPAWKNCVSSAQTSFFILCNFFHFFVASAPEKEMMRILTDLAPAPQQKILQ
jgi:hypothetical protein